MKLKHVDLNRDCVHQDAREVKTKFSKTFTTYFFPVGDEILEIVAEWVRFLREEKLWSNDDPLFPATHVVVGKAHQFEAVGFKRANWSTATPIRAIFREAFERAGFPYFHPHSMRSTLGHLGQQVCKSPEELKAWSQNLGHQNVLTTLMSYGKVPSGRQEEIIRGLTTVRTSKQSEVEELAAAIARKLQQSQISKKMTCATTHSENAGYS